MNQQVTSNRKIRAMLVERGISFCDIGRGMTPPRGGQVVSDTAHLRVKNPMVRLAIARALKMKVRDLFPDYEPSRRKPRKAVANV